jgi:hypothetical protein
MMFVMTERQVIYKLYKMRWAEPPRVLSKIDGYTTTYKDSLRRRYGIEPEEFKIKLLSDEYPRGGLPGWVSSIRIKLRPQSVFHFYPKLEDILKSCLENGYIVMEQSRYKVTRKGERLLSPFYFPKKILKYLPFIKRD